MAQQDHVLDPLAVTASGPRSGAAYLRRNCPCCGNAPPAQPEVRTAITADTLGFDELTPQWNGFFKEGKSIFSYVRCTGCGLLYAPVFFDNEQLGRLYAQMPPNMDEVPLPALRATQRGYFEALKRHSALKGGFIEVGPDVGLFTENCVREGQFDEYWLLEPNRAVEGALREVVNGRKHHIVHDMFGFKDIPEKAASAAVMIHVLDHLLDPVETLRQIRRTLTPGSTLVIVTHDESSLLRQVIGSRWPAFCLQHPQIYNPKSIRKLMDAAGFEVKEVSKTVNHFEVKFLLKHLLWALGFKPKKVPSFANAVVGLKLGNMLTVATPRGAA
jgi:hypothetical protein